MRKYKKSGKLPFCRLGEHDLQQLQGILISGFTDLKPYQLRMTAELRDGEITANSVDELLQERPPNQLANLRIYFYVDQDRTISLSLSQAGNRVSVEGLDHDWVLGRFEQLNLFFDARKMRLRPLVKRALFLVNTYILLPLSLFNIVAIIASIVIKQPVGSPLLTWGVACGELFVVPALIIAARPYSQIALAPKGRRLTPDNTLAIMVIFTVLSGVGGIGGFIAAVLALRK